MARSVQTSRKSFAQAPEKETPSAPAPMPGSARVRSPAVLLANARPKHKVHSRLRHLGNRACAPRSHRAETVYRGGKCYEAAFSRTSICLKASKILRLGKRSTKQLWPTCAPQST